MTTKGKNVPCEGCRERKKKCSSGQPCERCKRLGIDCHYLKPAVPPDLNYVDMVNSHELEAHVDELEQLMIDMEEEMRLLQQSPPSQDRAVRTRPSVSTRQSFTDDSVPGMSSNCSSSSGSTVSSPTSSTSTLTPAQLTIVRKRHPPAANWKLKIGKHGLCIETNILSYDDLLHQIQAFGFATDDCAPLLKQPSSMIMPTLHRYTLNSPLRRAHFQAVKSCIHVNEQRRLDDGEKKGNEAELVLHFKDSGRTELALKLLETFFSCQFYRSICLHRATFYSLFVDRTDPESSPAVCAIAAAILTMRCRHILAIVPYSQQINVHSYYIRRAKYMVAHVFDDLTLESYLTYLFIGLYYINLQQPTEATKYLEHCVRLRHLLADEYMPPQDSTTHSAEQELFKRSHSIMFFIAQKIEFYNNQRGIAVQSMRKTREQSRSMLKELFRYVDRRRSLPVTFPDEPTEVSRAISKERYGVRMHSILHPYLNTTRFSNDPIPLPLLVKTEAALNDFYRKDLPREFRLSLSIFESNLTDDEFRRRLSKEDNCDANSLFLAVRYYQALISIHEPFIPTLPPEYGLNNSRKDSQGVLSELSTNEDSTVAEKYEEKERAMHTLRALEICYRSAVVLVRLFEYVINDLDACTDLLMPCLLSAWDIHVRNACLGLVDPEEAQKHVPIRVVKASREYVLRCVDIVRKGYHYNAADRAMWEHHQSIESELLQAMFATRPYTAQYWDPWAPSNAW
ncbi:hypothetical protein BJV82DRAFT_635409 [Fennellomyces sp. T-0311]|nr:hypothetical protein BJV82DRAFT_635409 [Fennellomyces sp. T-0311]